MDITSIKSVSTDAIGFFRFKKLGKKDYLITNDIGEFSILTCEEFDSFTHNILDKKSEKHQELNRKSFFKGPNYEKTLALAYANKHKFLAYGPSLHMIITTLRCNHKCQYCHAAVAPMSAKEFDMTKETATKVVDTIFYTSSINITIEFQWGESLVNWDVVKHVVEYAEIKAGHLKKQLSFALVTNLVSMDEEKLNFLIDHKVGMSTSLDGNEEVHNYNRTYTEGNSYKKVIYWIKRINERYIEAGLHDEKWKPLRIGGALLTITKKTLPAYKEVIDTYCDLWMEGIFLRWLNPYWFAASELEKLSYSEQEWIDFYKKSMDYIIEINKKGTFFREQLTSVYLQKIFAPEDPSFMDIRSPSGIAIGCLAYNYDGKVYASDESRMLGRMGIEDFLMTDMKDTWKETYEAIMNAEVTKIAVQSTCLDGLPGYNDHVYKPYIWVDIIHNFKTTGNLYVPLVKDKKIDMQIAVLDYIFDKLRNNPEDAKILKSWIGL